MTTPTGTSVTSTDTGRGKDSGREIDDVDSLCSVTRRSFLIDPAQRTLNSANTHSPLTVPVAAATISKDEEFVRTASSGIVYSAPQ